MKRFLALSSAILFSTLLGVFFSGSSVNAQVVYQDFSPNVSQLEYGPFQIGSSNTCTSEPGTFTIGQSLETDAYYNFLLNEDSDFYYKKSWNYTQNQAGIRTYMDNFVADYQTAIQNPDDWDWGIFQSSMYDTDTNPTIVFMLGDEDVDFTVEEYQTDVDTGIYMLTPNGNVRVLAFFQNQNAGCRYQSTQFNNPTSYSPTEWRIGSGSTTLTRTLANTKFGIFTFTINNPDDYDVNLPPAIIAPPVDPESLKPEFFYTVNKDGLFNLQFSNNLPHFLTGTFYTNLDKMHSDWDGLDTQVTQFVSQPAGEMNESYTLPGAGYYMINISHNQDLHNPPWIRQDYYIEQIFMQFYWNGSTPISGDNTNCSTSELCNPWRSVTPGTNFGVTIQDYGLTQAIYAPLDFISTLPSKMASNACQPLVLPLPYLGEDLVLPCMRPIYETHFSQIYNLYSAIAVGLVSYYLAINLFARIKKDVSPTNDSIEVAKL